jgi:hypothetical protein
MRYGWAALLVTVGLLLSLPTSAEPNTGVLCVIPDPPGCCTEFINSLPFFDIDTLMFRIDNGKKEAWPQKTGLKIEGLSLTEKHLVILYSGAKRVASFRFSFTYYHQTELCLLFEGIGLPDLRPMSKLCHCK